MPYSGKSDIGKYLSEHLHFNFIDTDSIIEMENKDTIYNIFNTKGEDYFRVLEKKLLVKLSKSNMDRTIISTGGGMPIFFDNMAMLKKMGITIFLDNSLNIIIDRAKGNNTRPLLQQDIENNVLNMYNSRIEIYKQSHIHIQVRRLSIKDISDDIIIKINEFKEINNNVCK